MTNPTLAMLLTARGERHFSEPETQKNLRFVLRQLVPLHQKGKAHGHISLDNLYLKKGTVQLPPPPAEEPATPSQDIYALGLVALELLSGKVPSPRRQDPHWDWNEVCFVSDQFNQLLEGMLAPVASARFQTATAVLKAMETPGMIPPPKASVPRQSPAAKPISAKTPSPAAPSPPAKGMAGVFVALGTAATVVLLGGVGISLWLNSDHLSPATEPLGSLRQNEQGSTAMFRGNLARTGVYPGSGPKELTRLVWKFKTEAWVSSSPAIADGVVYFGSFDGHLYAVEIATGQERWRFKTEHWVSSSPAIADGVVYFGSLDGHLYAVEIATGQERWRFKTEAEVSSSPAIADGVVYFGSWDGHLYAVEIATGQERWRFKTEADVSSPPAIADGVVYFGSSDGHLYAVDIATGQERWRFKTESEVGSSPAIADGVVYFGSWDGHLYAVEIATGQERWRFKTEAGVGSSPAIADGVVYFGSGDGHLYAVE